MIAIENLEIHAAHGCDHSCSHCTHFSDHHFGGVLSLEEADVWMGYWSHRLRPGWFSILGGEPTLNPHLPELVELACLHWPNVRVVSNGSFLHRHPRLPEVLAANGVLLEISLHHPGPDYTARTQPIRELLARWQEAHGIALHYRSSYQWWQKIAKGDGAKIHPYDDGDPAASWRVCASRWCPQIHEGRLYKCPQVAYLPMMDRRYGLAAEWRPYLAYRGLEPGCSDEALSEFITRRDEAVCGMCPARPEFFELPNPLPVRVHRPATV